MMKPTEDKPMPSMPMPATLLEANQAIERYEWINHHHPGQMASFDLQQARDNKRVLLDEKRLAMKGVLRVVGGTESGIAQ